MILNLGCGKIQPKNYVNVDIKPPADLVMDLNITPWKWENNSIDGICMHHSLEHMLAKTVLDECHRVLKVGGVLDIHVPHSTCAGAIGCLSHYRTFSYNSLKDYTQGKFETFRQRIVYLPHWEWLPIQWLIDLNPIAFERFWHGWVGGATEVQWMGVKL